MNRMANFAELVAKEIGWPKTTKEDLSIQRTDRFAFYKIGRVLSVSVSRFTNTMYIIKIIDLTKYSHWLKLRVHFSNYYSSSALIIIG